MVTVSLVGRLGNQIFQISTCIAHALRNNTSYKIPIKSQDPRAWPAYFHHFPRLFPTDRIKHIYTEPEFCYNPIPFTEDTCLSGYFQSEKYFIDYREEIIKAFGFPWELKKGMVSIHVRRGDYVTHFSDKHPPVTEEYLCKAIAMFPNYKFLVFSDDMTWCKEHFLGEQFEFREGYSPVADLIEMSKCEHHIIANSSFSWMGAWFNRNPDKIVVAPNQWFGDGNSHLNTKDLIPESWIRL